MINITQLKPINVPSLDEALKPTSDVAPFLNTDLTLKPLPLEETLIAESDVSATLGTDLMFKQLSLDEASMPRLRLAASPGTDLWHKPPSPEVHNAPCYMAYLPISNFHRARVTVRANWTRQYDQGGLALFFPGWPSYSLWVKTGIEFVDGKPNVSTVAARDAADWSLLPISGEETSITIELAREEVNKKNGTGTSLWVYLIEGEERKALREMTWVFDKADPAELVSVGVYAARPTIVGKDDNECLDVAFDNLTIV